MAKYLTGMSEEEKRRYPEGMSIADKNRWNARHKPKKPKKPPTQSEVAKGRREGITGGVSSGYDALIGALGGKKKKKKR